jgi:peptidyl-dipeptidase A
MILGVFVQLRISQFLIIFKIVSLLSNLTNTLTTIFGVAKVCNKNECLVLDPDITDIMTESRDYDRLLYVWKGWHDATGRKMRKPFTKTVEIQNKAAKENGYKGNK